MLICLIYLIPEKSKFDNKKTFLDGIASVYIFDKNNAMHE